MAFDIAMVQEVPADISDHESDDAVTIFPATILSTSADEVTVFSSTSNTLPAVREDVYAGYDRERFCGALGNVVVLRTGYGDTLKDYKVHESVLCDTASFFDSYCTPSWKESRGNIIDLSDDPVAIGGMIQVDVPG